MDDLNEIKSDVKVIRESQIRMEEDVRHHILRTNLLETKVAPMWGAYSALKWLVAAVITIGLVLNNLDKIKSIF